MSNSPEQDRASDCKSNPELTGHSPKERGERVSIYEHCVRWLRRKRVTRELSVSDLAAKAKEFEHNIGADWQRMLADSQQVGPIDGFPHTALAVQRRTAAAKNLPRQMQEGDL